MTTGEGGAVTTDQPELARRMRLFRNHGITSDHRQRAAQGSWFYEMVELGYNYRISDIQCALGLSQLARLDRWVTRRQAIAARYDTGLASLPGVEPLALSPDVSHAYHLYVVRVAGDRDALFSALRQRNIGVNVHYIPTTLQPYYRAAGSCPVAEQAYQQILSLPMFPAMSDEDVDDVLTALRDTTG
jgi:perosamine synthetase